MNDQTVIEMPGSLGAVLTAVAKASGEMKRIAKESRNVEQKYDFASVDDFLAMAGPICAANGLTTISDEVEVIDLERQGKFGVTNWLRIKFAFTTYHASGAHLPPVMRTVEVIRTGAQSFGSAQSYALKQYLRGLHMIPTGDKDDPDFGGTVETHQERQPAPMIEERPARITADQFMALLAKMEKAGVDPAKIATACKVASVEEMLAADFAPVMKKLDATIAAKAPAVASSEIPY